MTIRSIFALALAGALLLPAAAERAAAQTGIIRFVVGLAPGGAVDPYARLIAEHMAKTLGRTIIVENKPGVGGNISAQIHDRCAGRRRTWSGSAPRRSPRSIRTSTATCAGRSTISCR